MAEIKIDATGKQCPIPVVMTTKELNSVKEPGTVEVRVDNEVAVQNLLRLASGKNLEAQGVEIITCGTCLDYYNLKEKLAVGSVTNMYTIVEKMRNA